MLLFTLLVLLSQVVSFGKLARNNFYVWANKDNYHCWQRQHVLKGEAYRLPSCSSIHESRRCWESIDPYIKPKPSTSIKIGKMKMYCSVSHLKSKDNTGIKYRKSVCNSAHSNHSCRIFIQIMLSSRHSWNPLAASSSIRTASLWRPILNRHFLDSLRYGILSRKTFSPSFLIPSNTYLSSSSDS